MQVTPPSPLSWDDVQLFLVLSRSRTMGEAAEALAVDPSTVSRRLAGLEEALDTTLFDRGRDGLRATKAAEDLLPMAEVAERGIAQFATAADGLEREVSGLVRLTCPPDTADVLVLPALRALRERHPELRFALEPGEQLRDLSRREADLALRVVRPRRGDLLVRRVMSVPWRAVATPELARRLGRVKSFAELPWIGWNDRAATSSPAAGWLASLGEVEPVLRSDRLDAQVAAAKAGLGVALLPGPTIEHHGLVPVELHAKAPDPEWPQDELYLVTHQALRHVPRVRATWDALLEHLGEAAGE